jgi:hypothetical protein
MGKTGIMAEGETQHSFFKIKTFSLSQIFSAGGATAFAAQQRKNPQNLAVKLKNLSKDSFLTPDEANSAIKFIRISK